MENLKSYIIKKQIEFDEIIDLLNEKKIFISIDTNSIDIVNYLDSVLILLNENFYNAKKKCNIIEIINDKYVINIEFIITIKSNKIYCNVQLKIKNYHILCRNSISKDYIYEDYNILNLSDKKMIDSIKNLFENINKNYIFCDCAKLNNN